MKIQEAIRFIVGVEKMRSREDLDIWCGSTYRHKLYEYVKRLAPEHWERLQKPKDDVRAIYETMLYGYKHKK